MKSEDRQQEIIEILVREGSAGLERFAEHFNVSTMTIHRDLKELEDEGLLRKIRGGATIESSGQFESDFRYRMRMALDEKRAITQHAASLIEPGMSVIIDDGSTSQSMIPFLIEKRPLTVISNNLAVITELAGKNGITLIALGGIYSKKFNGFFGILAEETLGRLRADIAFISSSAVNAANTFHQDQEVVELKRRMIASAGKCYLMVAHQKFGRNALHFLADLSAFDGVITTDKIDGGEKAKLIEQGIKLHLAQEGTNNE